MLAKMIQGKNDKIKGQRGKWQNLQKHGKVVSKTRQGFGDLTRVQRLAYHVQDITFIVRTSRFKRK